MTDTKYFLTGELAKRWGILPKIITDCFYQGKLRDDICPVVSGRRIIPDWYIEHIERVLRREGKLPMQETGGVTNA